MKRTLLLGAALALIASGALAAPSMTPVDPNGVPYGAGNPFPSGPAQNPSNSNTLACTLNSSTTTCGPFTPTAPDIHISWAPSAFTAACQVERKTDGTNWAEITVTAGGSTTQMANWSFSSSSQAISEDISEPQRSVSYQIHCTTTPSGSAAVEFSQ